MQFSKKIKNNNKILLITDQINIYEKTIKN